MSWCGPLEQIEQANIIEVACEQIDHSCAEEDVEKSWWDDAALLDTYVSSWFDSTLLCLTWAP